METSNLSGMCRCCALEGTFKDLKSTYHWMGEQEIYGDMLRECFNVLLSDEDDTDGGICEVCITQLRNAVNFKKRVLYTEEQFKKKQQNRMFKLSIVKVEAQGEDELDSDDNNMSADEAFPNTDYQVPIKFEEEPENPKPKKRSPKATASTSRVKKAKTDVGETSKRIASSTALVNVEPHKVSATQTNANKVIRDSKITINTRKHVARVQNKKLLTVIPRTEDLNKKYLHNVATILLYTNATLIKYQHTGLGFGCNFCYKRYQNAAELKAHNLDEHYKDINKFFSDSTITSKTYDFTAKLDVTSLICRVCNELLDSYEEAMDHLRSEHDKRVYFDVKKQVFHFKFKEDGFKCDSCHKRFTDHELFQSHLNGHYGCYRCPKCELAFDSYKILKKHFVSHKQGDFTSTFCHKIYETLKEIANNKKYVNKFKNKGHKCPKCNKIFLDVNKKMNHVIQMHGFEKVSVKCNVCEMRFDNKKKLYIHIKKEHLLERKYQCYHCYKKFYYMSELYNHMVKHTGTRMHQCNWCTKTFENTLALTQHLKVHGDAARFRCEYCGRTFTQQCNFEAHIQYRHGVILQEQRFSL